MKIQKLIIIALLIFSAINLSTLTFAQEKQGILAKKEDDILAKTKAKEVIDAARKAVSTKIDVSQIKTFLLSFEGTYNGGVELSEKYDYKISLPDKINRIWNIEAGQSNSTTVGNLNSDVMTIKEDSTWAMGTKSRRDFKKIENLNDEWIKVIKMETSQTLLPIVLDFPFIKKVNSYMLE
jgi:hypothetical protein